MRLLFPSLPFVPAEPEPAFVSEIAAAEAAGFTYSLYALEDARGGAPTLRHCPEGGGEALLHRGWMMSDVAYTRLFDAAAARGYTLVVDPAGYAEAHYLPLALRHLADDTPATVCMEGDDEDRAWELYQARRDADALIKDWVKSAKHRWREACFLPAGTERARFGEIFRAFRVERGRLFEKGVVIRRFHPLLQLGKDMRGMPVHDEHRLFFWRGELLVTTAPSGAYGPLATPDRWRALAQRFASPFLTLDVARDVEGRWIVVESGDGGVSGLPMHLPPDHFYRVLAERLSDLPSLARSLDNLSNRQHDVGNREDALESTTEAVALYRELARHRPEAFLPSLARSLDNLGYRHSLRQEVEALASATEAVALYRELAKSRPEAFLPDLARSLHNLAVVQHEMCQREEALASTAEVVALYRELAEDRPEAFLSDLARSLHNLGIRQNAVGQREEAKASTAEAVALYRELAEEGPE